jgi:hypothetical protein
MLTSRSQGSDQPAVVQESMDRARNSSREISSRSLWEARLLVGHSVQDFVIREDD